MGWRAKVIDADEGGGTEGAALQEQRGNKYGQLLTGLFDISFLALQGRETDVEGDSRKLMYL